MNIELDEVAVMDVSDDALEQAAGGVQGGHTQGGHSCSLGPAYLDEFCC